MPIPTASDMGQWVQSRRAKGARLSTPPHRETAGTNRVPVALANGQTAVRLIDVGFASSSSDNQDFGGGLTFVSILNEVTEGWGRILSENEPRRLGEHGRAMWNRITAAYGFGGSAAAAEGGNVVKPLRRECLACQHQDDARGGSEGREYGGNECPLEIPVLGVFPILGLKLLFPEP